MHVYPVNKLQGANIIGNVLEYSNVRNVFHNYLKHRAYFPIGGSPFITVDWSSPVNADTIIIGDTNCIAVSVLITYETGIQDNKIINPHENQLFNFIDTNKDYLIKNIRFDFTPIENNERPYVGYLFTGNKIVIPRFVTFPQWETQIRGESERTNDGQSYGIILPTLEKFTAQFVRIYDVEKKIVDDYVQSVQTVIAHVIDPYPEAHENVPPKYATLTKGINNTKRDENNFYWNFDLEWMEAR